MKKRISILLVVTMIMVSLAGCGSEQENSDDVENSGQTEPIELKLGTKMSNESIEGQAHLYFAELVEEKTDGEIKVVVYPSEQLGDADTQVNNVKNGSQDIYAEGLANFSNYAPTVKIENLPYLFTSEEQFYEVMNGDFGKGVEKDLEDNGFKLINPKRNFARGPSRVLLSTKPVENLEDLQGIRLRLSGNAASMNAYAALGANPIQIAWTETYLALKQGTVEAVTSPISLVYGMKFTEVAPYVAMVNEFPQYVAYVMNKDKFDSLSPEHQDIIIESANETGEYATSILSDSVDDEIELMKEEHGAVFTEVNTEPFREKLMDHYMELDSDGVYGEGVLKSILEN